LDHREDLMATPEMLAAVSAAVKGEVIPEVVVPPEGETPAAPETAEDLIGTPPGDTPAADTAPAAQPDEAGRLRDSTGKFASPAPKPADPAATAVAAPVAAAAAPAAPPKAVAVDPVNDPVPPNARPETRERITTLANMVKEKDTELTTTRGDLDLLLTPIKDAGASVEQFNESMNLLKLINSPMQHEQMQALEYLQGAAAALAERLGQVPPGVDPLATEPDLQQRVAASRMTRQDAEEVARARRAQAATQQYQQEQQQRGQQTRVQQQAIEQGQAAVREVEQGFQSVDPGYNAKVAIMRADTQFVAKLRAMPPTQWAAAFAQQYRTVKAPNAAPAVVTPPVSMPNAPTPLRAKQPAGNTAKAPTTQLEAVSGALARLRAG
jgi:hypothetical protein